MTELQRLEILEQRTAALRVCVQADQKVSDAKELMEKAGRAFLDGKASEDELTKAAKWYADTWIAAKLARAAHNKTRARRSNGSTTAEDSDE